MLTPKTILDEVHAIKTLKTMKISAFKVFAYGFFTIGSVVLYYTAIQPIKENVSKIPSIEQQVVELKGTIPQPVDTSIYSTIRNTNERIEALEKNTREIAIKVSVIKEEFPQLKQRFNDIERGFDDQMKYLKKNEDLSQIQ